MGGRGASSGLTSNSPTVTRLLQTVQSNQAQSGPGWQQKGDYDNGGNPALLKYQQQDDDKTADFLAGTERNIDLNDPQYADGYVYHDIPLNKLLLRLGVKGGPKVVSEADFNAYVRQTGEQVVYRGWSGGQSSAERFMNAQNNHVGNGRYGDGYYYTPDLRTAKAFGNGVITKMAIAPTARVISYQDLRSRMAQMSPKLQSALRYTGTGGTGRTFSPNVGEAQAALKLGYNAIDVGGGYRYAVTADALIVSKKLITY
ncbi:MAG: hypothetical protein IKN81_10410 [Oscillospiraceae bacterium]|nr:hypothetical protein [Oscillospiraceae bacterium]